MAGRARHPLGEARWGVGLRVSRPADRDESAPKGDSAEIIALFRTLPDADAREALVTEFLPLAEHLARRFSGRGESVDDLSQVASLGLLHAIDRFDPDRGVQFSTFAAVTMLR